MRISKRALLAVVLIVFALPLAACGGKDNESAGETDAGAGRGTITCEGSAMSGDAGLPANFPILPEMTLVKAEDKGPTHVVDGYAEDGIEGVYREMKDRLQEEQYTVLFSEIEEDRGDSEISYESPDGKTSGQIALRAACDNDNTSVHITARPA
jgi:hypothetical protein